MEYDLGLPEGGNWKVCEQTLTDPELVNLCQIEMKPEGGWFCSVCYSDVIALVNPADSGG